MDSSFAMQLIIFIEEEFNIQVIDEDLDLDLWAAGIEGRQTNVIATGENGVIDYDNSQSIDMEQERFALTSADFDNDGRLDVLSVGL